MNSKIYLFLCIIFSLPLSPLYAQGGGVTIGSKDAPHSSAILELKSSDRGFLPPRVTAAERKNISAPAAGLVVYDTDAHLLYMFNGKVWRPLAVTDENALGKSIADTAGTSNAFAPANTPNYDSDLGKFVVSDGNVWRDANTGCLPSVMKKVVCTRPGGNASSFEQSGNLTLFAANTARKYFDLVSAQELGTLVEANDSNYINVSENLVDRAYYNNTAWNSMNVTATAAGNLATRPRFLLTKTTTDTWAGYRKVGMKLSTNTTYLVQVLVQRKTCTAFMVDIVSDGTSAEAAVTLDLLTGDITGAGVKASGIISNAKAIPLKGTAGAWLFSFNFIPTTAAASNTTHQIRFVPSSAITGDALYIAAPSVTATSNSWGTYIAGRTSYTPRGAEFLKVDLGLQSTGTALVKGIFNDNTEKDRAVSWKQATYTGLVTQPDGFNGGYAIAENGQLLESAGQFVTTPSSSGTTYYFDASAAPNGDGSIGSPYNTLGVLQNFTGNLGGAKFLFKRGSRFRDQLYMRQASNFTVDAYGSGALPILDASDINIQVFQQDGASWYLGGRPVMQTIFVNNVRMLGVGTKQQMESAPNTSWFDAQNQRIYINSNGIDPNQQLTEISNRYYAGRIDSCSGFIVRNLQFQRAYNSGLAITSTNAGKSIVEYCVATYNGAWDLVSNLAGDGFIWYGLDKSNMSVGNIQRKCISTYNVNNCYEFDFQDSLVMEDCYGSRCGNGIELWGFTTNSVFQRNRIINVIPLGISWGHGNGMWFPNSNIQAPKTGGQNNNKISCNIFATTWNETLAVEAGVHEFSGNLFFDPTRRREDPNGQFIAVNRLGSDPVGVTFKNNIFYQPPHQGYTVAAFNIAAGVSPAILNNNFYYADPAVGGYLGFRYLGTSYGGDFNAYKTATGQDSAGSYRVDPKFVKVASKTVNDVFQTFVGGSTRTNMVLLDEDLTDFHLTTASAALSAGDPKITPAAGLDYVPFGTSRAVGPYSTLGGTLISLGDRWLGGLNFRGGLVKDVQASSGTLPTTDAVVQLSLCK